MKPMQVLSVGRSWRAEVALMLCTLLASVLSFGSVVVLYASGSGELEAAAAQLGLVSAASASAAGASRKPGSG